MQHTQRSALVSLLERLDFGLGLDRRCRCDAVRPDNDDEEEGKTGEEKGGPNVPRCQSGMLKEKTLLSTHFFLGENQITNDLLITMID